MSDPLPEEFLRALATLEAAYVARTDPIEQSGFGGGAARWRLEREPILQAIDGDGDFLDLGCANGHLAACIVEWGRERGLRVTPHGVDLGERLVALARARLPEHAANFHVADAWTWRPPRRYRYVYSLYDCVPEDRLAEYVRRLLERAAAPGGRVILGAYGSRSRGLAAFPIADFLCAAGFAVAGEARGGDPPVTAFAWIEAPA